MSLLGDARIVLSGTIVEGDYRRLVDLRADLLRAARLLRTVARSTDMFAAEYRAGAADAIRAARVIGRAHVDLSRFANASGGYYGFGWPVVQRRVQEQLEGAKLRVDSAHAAAYTGTHY